MLLTLRPLEDEQYEGDTHRPSVDMPSVQPDISAVSFLECSSNVGSHHDMYHKSVSFQNKKIPPLNSNSDIYILENHFHVLDTSRENFAIK